MTTFDQLQPTLPPGAAGCTDWQLDGEEVYRMPEPPRRQRQPVLTHHAARRDRSPLPVDTSLVGSTEGRVVASRRTYGRGVPTASPGTTRPQNRRDTSASF